MRELHDLERPEPHQFQPAGTMVMLQGGAVAPIESLRVGNRVVSFNRNAGNSTLAHLTGLKTQGRRVLNIRSDYFEGDLVRVDLAGVASHYTPDHMCLVKMLDDPGARYVVYVQVKDVMGRVGVSQIWYPSGGKQFGPAMRARHEKADAAWMLNAYPSEREALNAERIITGRYGLLMQTFKHPGNLVSKITQDDIDLIIKGIGDNTARVEEALNASGRDIRYPIWSRRTNTHVSTEYPFLTAASNLMSSRMAMAAFNGTSQVDWVPINVTREHYAGPVYHLEVETHRLYLGNGIVS